MLILGIVLDASIFTPEPFAFAAGGLAPAALLGKAVELLLGGIRSLGFKAIAGCPEDLRVGSPLFGT